MELLTEGEMNNDTLRNASGDVAINSKTVSFLYQLMRDHLTPGVVEKLVRESDEPDVRYTNGWLARYAEYLAKELDDSPKEAK